MISEKEFEVLSAIEASKEKLSQREISRETGYSVGTVNSTLTTLTENGLIENNAVTQKGLDELSPYRVKRIIFIAAGFGSRLVPITLNTPKPLIRIKGQRIIDTMIDAALEVGIEDIIIVRGYLSEQFDSLLYKYPMIKFVENPSYNEGNNISSAMCVRYMIDNTYICEADLLLKNKSLIKKYQYKSNYCGVKCDVTDDWCLSVSKNRITGVTVGGTNGYRMLGISYWNQKDGKHLSDCIEKAYQMPGGKERYWDSVPLTIFSDDFDLGIRECKFEDFDEIDTYNELVKLDASYRVV